MSDLHKTDRLYITTKNLKKNFGDASIGDIVNNIGYYTNNGITETFHSVIATPIITYTYMDGSISNSPSAVGKYDIHITASISPDPRTPLIPASSMAGYFTSKYDSTDVNVGDLYIIDTSKSLVIDMGIATITLTNDTHTYDGLSPTASYITTPPGLDCHITYDGSLIAPSDAGSSFTVSAIVSDPNYKVLIPVTAQHNIVMDTAAMAQSFNTKSGLLSPEGQASLKDPSGFITATLLTRLDVPQINAMSTIASLKDCAKSLPEKLIIAVATKAITLILNNIPGLGVANHIKQIVEMLEEAQAIMKLLQDIRNNPLGFLDEVLAVTGVYDNINDQIHALESKFPAIPGGVANVLKNIDDICNLQDYSILGLPSPGRLKSDPTQIPTAGIPTPMPTFDPTSNNAKMDYDAFLDGLKEATAQDGPKIKDLKLLTDPTPLSNYVSMMTSVSLLINSYHDDIKVTTDNTKDNVLLKKMIGNILRTNEENPAWDTETKLEFIERTKRGMTEIKNNTDVIRAYFMKNTLVPPGGVNSKGATTYSGPSRDFTTYLDIFPSERSPTDTAYWQSKGYDTNKPWNSTLHASDAYSGAYGSIVSDQTIASCRWPGDSVIALKNPDGSPYNPIGKNPSGTYTVKDTGNAKLTYARPDIYTDTPELYHGLEGVEAFVISLGTKKNSQYTLAQQNNPQANTNNARANV